MITQDEMRASVASAIRDGLYAQEMTQKTLAVCLTACSLLGLKPRRGKQRITTTLTRIGECLNAEK